MVSVKDRLIIATVQGVMSSVTKTHGYYGEVSIADVEYAVDKVLKDVYPKTDASGGDKSEYLRIELRTKQSAINNMNKTIRKNNIASQDMESSKALKSM